ncbi:Uncharacterised protein [Grimontia hollisae]|uniref:Uncharacterized protein n=1 Tax=Grimontia hollisae TaxID=673 RepID=A0A377J7Z9_GRIHO|nr:Uncharacterised protein [Grimontia hollisae]
MLFAIPSCESSLSNHFAKAPQVMLWDNQTNTKRILERPQSSSCCVSIPAKLNTDSGST